MMPTLPARTVSLNLTDSFSQKVFLFNKTGARQHSHSNCSVIYPHLQFDWSKKLRWDSQEGIRARAWGQKLLELSLVRDDGARPRDADDNIGAQSSLFLGQLVSELRQGKVQELSDDFFEFLVPIVGPRCQMYLLHAELIRHVMIEITRFDYWLDHESVEIKPEVLSCAMILIDLFFYDNVELFKGAIEGIGLRSCMTIPLGRVLAVGIPLESDNQATAVSPTHGIYGTLYFSNSCANQVASANVAVTEFSNTYTGCIDESGLEERLPASTLYVMLSDRSVSAGVELSWNY
jgi:hypothetical protein